MRNVYSAIRAAHKYKKTKPRKNMFVWKPVKFVFKFTNKIIYLLKVWQSEELDYWTAENQ